MSSVTDHLSKVREERIAREKARIDKLRELNLKKYSNIKKDLPPTPKPVSTVSFLKPGQRQSSLPKPLNTITPRPITAPAINAVEKESATDIKQILSARTSNCKLGSKNLPASTSNYKLNNTRTEKSNVTIRRAEVMPWNAGVGIAKPKAAGNGTKSIERTASIKDMATTSKIHIKKTTNSVDNFKKPVAVAKSITRLETQNNAKGDTTANNKAMNVKSDSRLSRKSFLPKFEPARTANVKAKVPESRKSFLPAKVTQSDTKINPNRQSVFERLYQPKYVAQKRNITDSEKILNDPNFFKKAIQNTGLILNKRHTVFESKKAEKDPAVRRSISAVHFRRISKSELSNCIHKWSSIGDKLDKVHLNEISEDAAVKEDKIVSAVKSERKKVKFQTPIYNFNTPRPEELQSRLQKWLQKRGKSIDSYHHLQCFGIHHLTQRQKEFKPVNLEATKFEEFDDEDKENKPVDSDTDNDSYEDNMNNKDETITVVDKNDYINKDPPTIENKDYLGADLASNGWRTASFMSDCVTEFNDTQSSNLTSVGTPHHVDELLLGALNDLTELLREGFDWEQCARWLRAIRERFPGAPATAAYWECRAALEEGRGDLPASVQCWEEAIAKGTERSVVEANLDQLLDKFMQLRISPSSGKRRLPDPKLVDVKNVFKSTLIRFAVQQAKLRQSQELKFTVTPVRRSARISMYGGTPSTQGGTLSCNGGTRVALREVSTVRAASELVPQHPVTFVPNDKLCDTP